VAPVGTVVIYKLNPPKFTIIISSNMQVVVIVHGSYHDTQGAILDILYQVTDFHSALAFEIKVRSPSNAQVCSSPLNHAIQYAGRSCTCVHARASFSVTGRTITPCDASWRPSLYSIRSPCCINFANAIKNHANRSCQIMLYCVSDSHFTFLFVVYTFHFHGTSGDCRYLQTEPTKVHYYHIL